VSLAHALMDRGELDEAGKLLDAVQGDFAAEGLAALVRLKQGHPDGTLGAAADALLKGDTEAGLQGLITVLDETEDDELRDHIRKAMVGVFTELGADDPLTREYRRKLASALY
jgi:thioredoxin-like negative regulator of GroEL